MHAYIPRNWNLNNKMMKDNKMMEKDGEW